MSFMTSSLLTSSAVFPAAGLLTSPPPQLRNIDADVREFWSSFPCPPPWRPSLLVEVNSTRLNPSVSRTVQSFLAGKCEIRHVLFPSDPLNPDTVHTKYGPRWTDAPDHGSSLSDPAEAGHPWCDTPCQLSIGCALFFVVVVTMVTILVCVTKHRVRHKMTSARPSRQQLQLSTSTSDAVNCAEFTNLEVQGDDDIIYPPFRHRGLPIPPPPCHPACDPKWNCPSCAIRHPLMRMSPSSHCYSRAYSAVYETIDDDEEEEEARRTDECSQSKPRVRTPTKSNSRESCHSCSPCHTSPTSISTVQIRPRALEETRGGQQVAETGFNGEGDESQERFGFSFLSNYFELEHNCALSDNAKGVLVRETSCLNSFPHNDVFGDMNESSSRSELAFPSGPSFFSSNVLVPAFHQPQSHTSLTHSDLYRPRTHHAMNSAPSFRQDQQRLEELRPPTAYQHSKTISPSVSTCSTFLPLQNILSGSRICGSSTGAGHPQGNAVCPAPSFQPVRLSSNYYCNGCRQDELQSFERNPILPRQRSFPSGSHHSLAVGPDLLKEASNQIKQDLARSSKLVVDGSEDNNEVPLRKPVLALHSQYFAKTSAA